MGSLPPQESTMSHPNALNVYKGPDSMPKYFDPDSQPPLALVELPARLNPLRGDNVRIYAKMMTALPTQNVKGLPALNMLLNNPPAAKKAIIEQSSGSTAMSLGIVAQALYNNKNTRAYTSNKNELNRIRQLQFFGLNVELYGGPSQPEITDPRGVIRKAQELAEESENFSNPNQYENDDNWEAHIRWTGPQLWKQLPEINVFCVGMGTAGCITGTGMYLKSQKPSITVLGVCNTLGDSIPGPRPFPLLESCDFPWKKTVDAVENIGSVDAYRMSVLLSREGLICGPSSGMALKGLLNFLQRAKETGALRKYADPATGEISCVFLICDLPYQYLDGYFERLGEEDFPPIINESLLHFDTDMYDAKWEIRVHDATKMLHEAGWKKPLCNSSACRDSTHSSVNPFSSSNVTLLDLRDCHDFEKGHICGAISTPLPKLTAASPSPSDDVKALQSQWTELKAKFRREELRCSLNASSGPMIVLCYHGETSRVATAVMRGQGLEAYSIKGGMAVMN